MSEMYKKAGVDVEKGYEAVEKMKKHIAKTTRPEVLGDVGAFAGLFDISNQPYKEPVLVSGTDGVGTKMKLGFGMVADEGCVPVLCDKDNQQYKAPVLVSGTDGVGTNWMLAFEMDKHDTIGIDVVAMCVNDIVAQGAQPLFFLDYIGCGENNPSVI